MRTQRIILLAASIAVVVLAACSSDDAPARSSDVPAPDGVDAGRDAARDATRPSADAEAGTDAAGSSGDAAADPPIVVDTPCGKPGGVRAIVAPGGGNPPTYDRLGIVGTRRAAQGSGGEGLRLFDADGKNPGAFIAVGTDANWIAAGGPLVGVVGHNSPDLTFRRFDAAGSPAGDETSLGSVPNLQDLALGRSGEAFLAVWAAKSGVQGRSIDATGAAGAPFVLDAVPTTKQFSASVTAAGAGFGVLWFGVESITKRRTVLALTSATAQTASQEIDTTPVDVRRIVQVVKTPSGFAALVEAETGAAILLLLGPTGALVQKPITLDGTRLGYGLAVQGTEVGVLAQRADRSVEFRAFASNGAPLSGWLCVEPPVPGPRYASIDADGAGYAVLAPSTGGAVVLTRFDRTGL